MKKRCILIWVISCIVIMSLLYATYITMTIDIKYATGFAQAFEKYNIDAIDSYLSENTIVICNDKKGSYKDLRTNVISACENKQYVFRSDSSYGNGNNTFKDDIQIIDIVLYGEYAKTDIGECNISMKLKRNNLFSYEIYSIECDNVAFDKIFFGEHP